MEHIVKFNIGEEEIEITDLTPFPILLCEFLYEGDFELMKADLKNNSKFIEEAKKIEKLVEHLPGLTSNFVIYPFVLSEFLAYFSEFQINYSDLVHISLNGLFDTVLLEADKKNFDFVKDVVDFILKIDPSFAPAYELMGSVLVEKGEMEEGEEYLEKAVKLDPWNIAALSELGELYFNLGEYEKAAAIWKKELELSPNNYVTYFMIADAYMQKGDYEKAAHVLEKFLNRFPNSILGKYELCTIYEKLSRTTEANELKEEILNTTPEYSTDIEVWAKVMFENGKYKEVQNFLEKYIDQDKENEHFKLLLVIPYLKVKRFDEAKSIYQEVKDKYMWYIYGLEEILNKNLTKEELKVIEKV
jgi:predicted Zn-dependent protease